MVRALAYPQEARMTKQEETTKADNTPVLDPANPKESSQEIRSQTGDPTNLDRQQRIHTVLGGTLKYPPTCPPTRSLMH